jgi:poly-beta-1,6-N-acetyl-D-glucosamine biosynthesis protein PgaD
MKNLIIENSKEQTFPQKYGYRLLTGAFWAGFLYLLRPLLTLIAWLLGFSVINETMLVEEGWRGLVFVGWYGIVIAVMGLSLEGWALYNILRFRGKEKRRSSPAVRMEEMCAFFAVDPGDLAFWHKARVLVMLHDADGRLVNAEVREIAPGDYPGEWRMVQSE